MEIQGKTVLVTGVTEEFSTMPPHPEVPAALHKLRDAGFRLFTLTDNLLEVQTRQLKHGGIVDLSERRFSADGVKHHKPSPQAYGYGMLITRRGNVGKHIIPDLPVTVGKLL